MGYVNLQPGDPAPQFRQRSFVNPRYAFDTVAGRYVVLCFLGTAADPLSRQALEAVAARTDLFDDDTACFFGVTADPQDEAQARIRDRVPGMRFLLDFDLTIARLYGATDRDLSAEQAASVPIRRFWVVTDPTLRVIKVIEFGERDSRAAELLSFMDSLPPKTRFAGMELQAPVLVLPNVFEPELCQRLIGLYETHGGTESGFMQEDGGKTVARSDPRHKRRRDYDIDDPALISELQGKFLRRVVPEIAKVHQFKVTRMERYIVACYAAEEGGHFRAHRDNTTKGTAHRRFAVSVNLNEDFEGGEVSFPEYGPRGFKAPAGGAVVFSCSLLHAVSTVTRGRRYAFLPFLYDDAAAKIREENNRFLGEGVGAYGGAGQPARAPSSL